MLKTPIIIIAFHARRNKENMLEQRQVRMGFS